MPGPALHDPDFPEPAGNRTFTDSTVEKAGDGLGARLVELLMYPTFENKNNKLLDNNRFITLTDGVFAIAMTILVFNIKVPDGVKLDDRGLWHALKALSPILTDYAVSFFLLASLWMQNHRHHSWLKGTNRGHLWLGMLYLMFVGLIPFTTSLMAQFNDQFLADVLFHLNLMAVGLCTFGQWHYASRRGLVITDHAGAIPFKTALGDPPGPAGHRLPGHFVFLCGAGRQQSGLSDNAPGDFPLEPGKIAPGNRVGSRCSDGEKMGSTRVVRLARDVRQKACRQKQDACNDWRDKKNPAAGMRGVFPQPSRLKPILTSPALPTAPPACRRRRDPPAGPSAAWPRPAWLPGN